MRTAVSAITALTLALLLGLPALAAAEQEDKVTKTFELTLHGDVPKDRLFLVAYGTMEDVEAGTPRPSFVIFCGQLEEDLSWAEVVVASDEDCVGNGKVYRADVEFERGTSIYYAYQAQREECGHNCSQIFYSSVDLDRLAGDEPPRPEDSETLNGDTTTSAYYRFGGNGGGQPVEMPDTGAGGAAREFLPAPYAAAGLALLAASGYAIRRRAARRG